MIEKIKVTNKRYRIDFDVYLVWLTWFPFIGWMYPFIFKKGDNFAMHHAKQAFILALFFTAAPIVITFLSAFVPITLRAIKLAFVISVYLSHCAYFCVCAGGFLKIKDKSMYEFPVVMKFADKLDV
ncbi:MAG: hypothetical protein A2W19_13270 [Spirochaetes bacterium RBG_16_49_21]|nr:MAG: hypothetical protein A2W19_13270 [Spirochaetes bacterium RBG_16_49_21]